MIKCEHIINLIIVENIAPYAGSNAPVKLFREGGPGKPMTINVNETFLQNFLKTRELFELLKKYNKCFTTYN